jgi:hypothetical protein
MSLHDDLESDLDLIFDEDDFAEFVGYTSREIGEQVLVRAIIDYGQIPNPDSGNTNASHAIVHIPRIDLAADPKNGDFVEIDSVEWSVIRQISSDKLVVRLELRRDVRNRYK